MRKGYVVSTTCGTWALGPGYKIKNQQVEFIDGNKIALETRRDCYDHQYSIIEASVSDENLEKDEFRKNIVIRNELTIKNFGNVQVNGSIIILDNTEIHLEFARSEKDAKTENFLPVFFEKYEDAERWIQRECNLSLAYAYTYDR
jgi:hypothetical protein